MTYDDWKALEPELYFEPEPEEPVCECIGEHGTECPEFEPPTLESLRSEPC